MPRTYASFPRLFVEPDLAIGSAVTLDADGANYIVNVRRKTVGDSIILFNSRDGAWLSKIETAGKKHAVLQPVVQTAHQTPASDLWFGFAPLKTGRLDWLVERATELGAGIIQPVITERTQSAHLRADKIRAWTIEAAQQSEVLSLPVIAPEISLVSLLEGWRNTQGLRRLIVADEAAPAATPVEEIGWLDGLPIGVLIGPEGGFTDAELALLRAQDFVLPISLGPRILRADTAAIAALTLVQAIIGDWR